MAESAPHTNLVLHASGIYRWISWRPIKSQSTGFFYAAGRDVTVEIEGKSDAESFIRLLCHEIRNPLLGIMGVTDLLLEQRTHLQTLVSSFDQRLTAQQQQQPQDATAATTNDTAVDTSTTMAANTAGKQTTASNNAALIQQAKHYIDQGMESVDLLRNCCAQLNSVVNTTLNVSKLTSGKSELIMAPFQPRAVLESSSDVMMGLAMGRNVALQVWENDNNTNTSNENNDDDDESGLDDPSLCYYMGDQAWLTQVIINIMSNSIKFTREGGHVTAQVYVTSREPSQQVTTNESTQQQQQQQQQQQPEHGSVVVGAAPDMKTTEQLQALDKLVVFTVTDTGVGMTELESEELFQPFMNTSSSSCSHTSSSPSNPSSISSSMAQHGNVPPGPNVTNYANCGLGLHISHSVITRMGGTIEVTSKVGKGTSVCIKIPTRVCTDDEISPKNKNKHDDNANAMGSRCRRGTSSSDDDGTLFGSFSGNYHDDHDDHDDTTAAEDEEILPPMNIMVVDDVRLNRSIASRILRATGEHNICEAIDGFECLQTVTSMIQLDGGQTLDLILMDICMPGIDGLETTRRLRSGMLPRNCQQPYIAGVSAFSSPEDRAAALESGMDAYVVKPYSRSDFLVVLREALSRKEQFSHEHA
jgi:signal transduction histidine kinase/AmiR/NasT family two-component response regulator